MGIEKLAARIKDISRRTERTAPLGEQTAQGSNVTPAETFGAEDHVVSLEVKTGLTVGSGMLRVGEFALPS